MTLAIDDEDELDHLIKKYDVVDIIRTLAMITGKRSIAIEETNRNRMRIAQSSLVALADYLDTIYVR